MVNKKRRRRQEVRGSSGYPQWGLVGWLCLYLFLLVAMLLVVDVTVSQGQTMELPPQGKMVGWEVNEIPRSVTVYIDTDGNGHPDVVLVHPIRWTNQIKCADWPAIVKDAEKGNEYLFTTCTDPGYREVWGEVYGVIKEGWECKTCLRMKLNKLDYRIARAGGEQ